MNKWSIGGKFGVIFDMDGVIINTCKLHEDSWYTISQIRNFEWDKNLNFKRDVFGTCSIDSAKILFKDQVNDIDFEKLCKEKDEIYEDLLHKNIKYITVKGFKKFFKSLVQSGVPIILGTSATSEEAEFVLSSLEIRQYFKGIINISMVNHPKPHPEVYIKASAAMGVPVERCLGFEDSISGITALNNAGIRAIVVGSTLSYEKLCKSGLDFSMYIEDFSEINVHDIFEVLKEAI